jgi:cytoskeletal protein CcmA (bactofilin family)
MHTLTLGGSRMHIPTSQEVKEAFGEIDDKVSILPPAPTLPPVTEGATENDPASAEANDVRVSAETKILTKVMEKSPEGSSLTYSADQLGVLFSVAEPVVPGTEAYAEIERFAQAHQCSLSFAVGTVTFTKGSPRQTSEREMFGKSKDKYEDMLLACKKALQARFASAFEAIVHASSDSTVGNDPVPSSQEQRPASMHSEESVLTDPTSSIGRGVTVVGKIFGEGTVQLFGRIEGEVRASTVLIKEGAQVEGAVVAEELTIAGQVKGTIHANRVKLDSTAVVEGDIFHRLISIEENARFEGLSKREDDAGDMLRSRLSRSSAQDDRQTNDRVQRALDVVAASGEGSRGAADGGLRDNSGSGNRGDVISVSPSPGVVPCDTGPSR